MKKHFYLVVAMVVLTMFSLTSCKKECTCVSYIDGEEVARTTVEVKGKCSSENSESTVMGIVLETKCN